MLNVPLDKSQLSTEPTELAGITKLGCVKLPTKLCAESPYFNLVTLALFIYPPAVTVNKIEEVSLLKAPAYNSPSRFVVNSLPVFQYWESTRLPSIFEKDQVLLAVIFCKEEINEAVSSPTMSSSL